MPAPEPTSREQMAASALFADQLPRARRYADLLSDLAGPRGLIGPREIPRLWERHLLNCAVVGTMIPAGATVCDVGSGAGLPGVPVALARPDLRITLVEPMLRRSTFLEQTVRDLQLANVAVRRARAETLAGTFAVRTVLARAVAPMTRLAEWTLPLLEPGGVLLALKGESASAELLGAAPSLRGLGAVDWAVEQLGRGLLACPTTVVRVVAGRGPRPDKRGQDGRA